MKVRTLALSLLLAITLGVTAGCNNNDGVTRSKENGKEIVLRVGDKSISVDDLFNNLVLTKDGVEGVYNAVDKVVILSSFEVGDEQQKEIDKKIKDFEDSVRSDASSTGLSYTAMREIKLAELGLKNMDELKEYYTIQVLRPEVEELYFPTEYPSVAGQRNELIKEYVEEAAPMHLKHILVKVADSKLYTGFISESEAITLARVATRLTDGGSLNTFKRVAYEESQDDSSRVKSGDLGIVDRYTNYVTEFKYGLYAYLAKGLHKGDEKVSEVLNVPADFDIYDDGFRVIPVSKVKELAEKAEETVDNPDNKSEITATYPRNEIFNEYFNFPSVAFLAKDPESTATKVTFDENGNPSVDLVTDENGNPIVLVRSTYGIHFISVTKSAFDEDTVAYYTEVKDTNAVEGLDPYILQGSTTSEKKTRYDEITSAVKNYINGAAQGLTADQNILKYRIFKYFLEKEDITFNNELEFEYGYDNKKANLETIVLNYIDAQVSYKKLSVDNTIELSWLNYKRQLEREIEQRA